VVAQRRAQARPVRVVRVVRGQEWQRL